VWGEDLVNTLGGCTLEQRGAFILMQRIMPRDGISVLTREGTVELTQCLSELGVFGACIG
jgi:hypothetical protein